MPKLPAISSKKFCRFLEHIGCYFKRIEGDHYVYNRPGLKRPIIVPIRTTLPTFIIFNNLRTLGISREEFLRILEEI